jgi:hypothetical protein
MLDTKIAIVTSTIGRPTLHQTIASVKNQIIPCRHYVFVHGKEHWENAKKIIDQYPDVEGIYLPNNNGGNGYAMAPVFALAPFVVAELVTCYLDDDNWIESSHCSNALQLIETYNLDWAYSLRQIVNNTGEYLCPDDCESIGIYTNIYGTHLVDNSCYAVKTETLRKHAHTWYIPRVSDRTFLAELMKHNLPCACTGVATANYRLSADGSHSMNAEAFQIGNSKMHELFPNGLAWHKPALFNLPSAQSTAGN